LGGCRQAHGLAREPWCAECAKAGIRTRAVICDHVTPHRGDEHRFWGGPIPVALQTLPRPREAAARAFRLCKRGWAGRLSDRRPSPFQWSPALSTYVDCWGQAVSRATMVVSEEPRAAKVTYSGTGGRFRVLVRQKANPIGFTAR